MRSLLERMQIPLRVAAAIALAYLAYVFLARYTSNQRWAQTQTDPRDADAYRRKFMDTYGGTALKIMQFYVREGVITEGQTTLLCYGVLNAKSLSIDPPVEKVYPALNHCFNVAPTHTTRYTLTAKGDRGQTATAQFTLTVNPDLTDLPRIIDFHVIKHTVEQGRHYFIIAFAFQNARSVAIDPPAFSPLEDSAPFGQFPVAPQSTTTYTLTVTDKKGRKASKQLKVEVPGT